MRLKRALYGLPQAGQLWHRVIHEFLIKIGFTQNKADLCVYWKRENKTEQGELMIISLTVDDILDVCNNDRMRSEVIRKLQEEFDYIDEGECEWFLGMQIRQDFEKITIDQEEFVKLITDEYPKAHKTNVPGKPGKVLESTGMPMKARDGFSYQQLCGKLRYLTMT